MLKKKINDFYELVVLYVEQFEWLDEFRRSLTKNLPEPNRIYRAIKSYTDNSYYVAFDSAEPIYINGEPLIGIRVNSLSGNGDFSVYKMVELNDDNITDFDISSDDYKKIASWMEDGHTEFLTRVGLLPPPSDSTNNHSPGAVVVYGSLKEEKDDGTKNSPTEAPNEAPNVFSPDDVKRILASINDEQNDVVNEIKNEVQKLLGSDFFYAQVLLDLVKAINEKAEFELKLPIIPISKEIAIGSKYHTGANIYMAFREIERYLIEKDDSMLIKACIHLLNEIIAKDNNFLQEV